MRQRLIAVLVLVIGSTSLHAHYNMLLPAAPSGKKDETMTFTYQFGHPFEHQLFNAPKPESLTVRGPDGKTDDLMKSLENVMLPTGDGKTVTGYRFSYMPKLRGDFVFVLQTPPIWMAEEGEFIQDAVKVVLHVQAQKGWDQLITGHTEWRPLTRPYGLQPGLVFQGQLLSQNPNVRAEELVGLPHALVEIERYNAVAPKTLPPDEQITRTAKTDPNGVVTCTLTDPGWWAITGVREGGTRKHDGKDAPVKQRSTLWVFVDEKAK